MKTPLSGHSLPQDDLLSDLVADCIRHFEHTGRYDEDPIRNKTRVEIPAAFLAAAVAFDLGSDALKSTLIELVLAHQQSGGYWLEYSYEPEEEAVGYYGAVPTCFAIISLSMAVEASPSEGLGQAMIRGADYLYSVEQDGCFLKASINKTDVLNTNLLCAVALLAAAAQLAPTSRRAKLYPEAARRAIRRAMSAQLFSGALPYTHVGFQVPFLYHAMSTALLESCQTYYPDARSLSACLGAARRFLMRMFDDRMSVRWDLEHHPEKSRASWMYAWSVLPVSRAYPARLPQLIQKIALLKTDTYLANESSQIPDVFYTAWTLLAVSLAKRDFRPSLKRRFSILLWMSQWGRYGARIGYIGRYAVNKWILGRWDGLDKGPVEYW